MEVVALDGDDTLWHSETYFADTHARFAELLAPYVPADELEQRLLEVERRNLDVFGYGVKGFTLSLLETAIAVSSGRIPADDLATIIGWGKAMLDHPVELLDGVADAIDAFRARGLVLVLITKGDLWHQESKVAASGIADHFDAVEIVAEKDVATYRAILERHGIDPARFCMIGNSVRSDILPVLALGGRAVHVPYDYLWAHEAVDDPGDEHLVVRALHEVVALFG